jgi:hypothetical protein
VFTGLWWENLKERDHLEEPGPDGRTILKRIFRKWEGGMNLIDLAHVRDRFRALVNAVMNVGVP